MSINTIFSRTGPPIWGVCGDILINHWGAFIQDLCGFKDRTDKFIRTRSPNCSEARTINKTRPQRIGSEVLKEAAHECFNS